MAKMVMTNVSTSRLPTSTKEPSSKKTKKETKPRKLSRKEIQEILNKKGMAFIKKNLSKQQLSNIKKLEKLGLKVDWDNIDGAISKDGIIDETKDFPYSLICTGPGGSKFSLDITKVKGKKSNIQVVREYKSSMENLIAELINGGKA